MEFIPTVDMESEDLRELSDDARRLALGERILAALRGIGFVYLLNHDLPESLRSSVFQTGLRFFDLPLETKLKYHRFVRAGANGYMPPAEEDLSRSETADGAVHELKESWDMRTPDGGLPTADAPQFGADVSSLMPALSALSLRVLGALEAALGRPGLFSTAHRRQLGAANGSTLRAVHYPPVPGAVPAGAVRCATHSDWGSVTLLLQDQCGGLEVLSRAGRWVPAPPVPGAVLLNVGDLMEIWTGGEVVATKHRVLVPPEERARCCRRLSVVFFSHPDDEVTVAPPDGSQTYHAVNAGEYLADKYNATNPSAPKQG
ncbi:proline hydroxylase buaE-like [Amphibalanus amphitrite]|uniref:proline hydroxylase buaE-like n=1 Tax=Amphibalanus amphitrite TaxID=1232801 RepID=UPI001C914E92|nr:proline hydroxylase buaE-like [Amphibalanus amphitrite]